MRIPCIAGMTALLQWCQQGEVVVWLHKTREVVGWLCETREVVVWLHKTREVGGCVCATNACNSSCC